jgi:hypothetical protein
MAEYSPGLKQMSKLSGIQREHAKWDMIEGSMRLRKCKFLLDGMNKSTG